MAIMKSALLICLVLLAANGCDSKPTTAENNDFPTGNLQIICPWGAGGGTDRISRYFAEQLKERLGVNCVVVNRTGGSGAVGHRAGAEAKPNGSTIAMITAELSTMHQLGITDITYRDYNPLIQMNGDPAAIIVNAESEYGELNAFLSAVKQAPGELKMSGTATGGTWDLARVGLFQKAGLTKDDVTWVPTKGSAESIQMLLGGHLDAVCCSLPEAALQLNGGQLKAIAVMAEDRAPAFEGVPTAIEQGVQWSSIGWRGFATQVDTPADTANILRTTLTDIANSEAFREFMNLQGFQIDIKSGVEFSTFLEQQDEQWKEVLEHYVSQ